MLIYPAIDFLDGRCVRLKQGGFDSRTVYSDDPITTLPSGLRAGATLICIWSIFREPRIPRSGRRNVDRVDPRLDSPSRPGRRRHPLV